MPTPALVLIVLGAALIACGAWLFRRWYLRAAADARVWRVERDQARQQAGEWYTAWRRMADLHRELERENRRLLAKLDAATKPQS